ncbi:MAG TPA: hypothetical protein VKX28_12945, partial [Xanthobacteraceae bacterium]|nr:hypothetical protein [Xanthobacteraceae bacterium]
LVRCQRTNRPERLVPGRDQIGKVGDIVSESPGDFKSVHPGDIVGIRKVETWRENASSAQGCTQSLAAPFECMPVVAGSSLATESDAHIHPISPHQYLSPTSRSGIGMVWLHEALPDHLAVVGDGAVEITLGGPGDAARDVGVGIFRIEPDRLIEVRNGAVEVALVAPGHAADAIGDGAFGSSRIAWSKSAMATSPIAVRRSPGRLRQRSSARESHHGEARATSMLTGAFGIAGDLRMLTERAGIRHAPRAHPTLVEAAAEAVRSRDR